MKRFKKQSDLVRHAVKRAIKRIDNGEPPSWMQSRGIPMPEPEGDFLQNCAMKLRMPR